MQQYRADILETLDERSRAVSRGYTGGDLRNKLKTYNTSDSFQSDYERGFLRDGEEEAINVLVFFFIFKIQKNIVSVHCFIFLKRINNTLGKYSKTCSLPKEGMGQKIQHIRRPNSFFFARPLHLKM